MQLVLSLSAQGSPFMSVFLDRLRTLSTFRDIMSATKAGVLTIEGTAFKFKVVQDNYALAITCTPTDAKLKKNVKNLTVKIPAWLVKSAEAHMAGKHQAQTAFKFRTMLTEFVASFRKAISPFMPTASVAKNIAPNFETTANGVIKFKPFTPEISKSELEQISKSLPLAAQREILLKLGTRCLRFFSSPNTKAETWAMFWTFAFTPRDGSFKTVWGKLTKYQLFGLMAASPYDTLGTGVEVDRQKGTAACRVCGKPVGSSDRLYAGKGDSGGKIPLRMPDGAAAHYRTHGIKPNFLRKNVLDKATGKMFSVLYVGKVSDVKSAY